MNNEIPIQLAVEDSLSEVVLRTILKQTGRPFAVGTCYGRQGFGYLKKNIRGFNNAAKGVSFLILTDLNSSECPPILIKDWLPISIHANLLFRIAVREIESWLIADRRALASFLVISETSLPEAPDNIENPKDELIRLASRSRRAKLRNAIVPRPGSTARIGPDYNGTLARFVLNHWDVNRAIILSPSLKRAWDRLMAFNPIYIQRDA